MEMKRNYVTYPRVQSHPFGESRTQQNLAEQTDINWILRNQAQNGVITHVNKHQGQYGDFSSGTEYHEAMNMVSAADQMFASLPAEIRNQFANNTSDFLEFVADPENREEMAEMGLIPSLTAEEKADPPTSEAEAEPPAAAQPDATGGE